MRDSLLTAALAVLIALVCVGLTGPSPDLNLPGHETRASDVEHVFQRQQFRRAEAVAYVEADRIFKSLQHAALLDLAHQEAARAARLARRAPQPAQTARTATTGSDSRSVSSTAYCLTGTMANGERAHRGAAAMNGVPLGSRWQVSGGPMSGAVFTVEDRIGHSSGFDIAMPGDCAGAVRYGRHNVTVARVG